MRPLNELQRDHAHWVGSLRWKRHFELRQGVAHFATLNWENASGSIVIARTAGALWLFERVGGPSSRITIRSDVRGLEITTFTTDWKDGGRLTVDGGHYVWRALGASLTRWTFRSALGPPLFELRVDSKRLVPSGTLAVVHEAVGERALPLLVSLGWYLTVQTLENAAVRVPAGLAM